MNFSQELVNMLLATAPVRLYLYLFYISDMFEQRTWRSIYSGAVTYRGAGGLGVQPTPPKLRMSSKIVPNSTRLWKLLKNSWI